MLNGLGVRMRHVCDGTAELAISLIDDTMMKHGSARSVEAWAATKGAGYDVTIIRLPVSEEAVEELNRCVRNTNRAAALVAEMTETEITAAPLSMPTRFP
jgi:hypothetical protein